MLQSRDGWQNREIKKGLNRDKTVIKLSLVIDTTFLLKSQNQPLITYKGTENIFQTKLII